MVKRPCFERGDIVLVGFDPANGHEQKGAGRPALVLSVSAFNQPGMTLVAPVTQGGNFARYAGFSVPLSCEEGNIQGVILVNQIRMMDLGLAKVKPGLSYMADIKKPRLAGPSLSAVRIIS
ncbi:type II toxin-antitoxin system ChpB family toxin [Enterobacter chengduensis]|uniref:Toxin ChpB n=1 Tax=Enterobacter chengduensis TaxID=2494701 RepID=A0AAW3HID6_9ENTR|nr:toxin ChpB [Enterobacter chengduensis]OTW35112.1 toxin ChpB [Enterobacter kobei]GJL41807.1 hypothetical protein TUM17577_30160 [Enterobacter asburiae]MBN9879059.1 type II toxin-antitoxin system ChpB family toxin [Enterobacter chengduensis]MBT1936258.1 type II toxin-antitoxin system ChpB family toxin [Enterobacter chengduensis]